MKGKETTVIGATIIGNNAVLEENTDQAIDTTTA